MAGYILQMEEEGVIDGNLGGHTTEWQLLKLTEGAASVNSLGGWSAATI